MMESNMKKAEDISLGELIGCYATETERQFAMDPVVVRNTGLTSTEHLSMVLANLYNQRTCAILYLQQLRKDRECRKSTISYLLARTGYSFTALTDRKPIVLVIILLAIMLVLSIFLPLAVSIGISAMLGLILALYLLHTEQQVNRSQGLKPFKPAVSDIDAVIARQEVILTAARRELWSLEEQDGLPREAWPFVEKIWEQLEHQQAHSLDEALVNLGFEFEAED